MHGIVSLLDSAHDRLVEALWAEFAIDNLTLVYDTGTRQEARAHYSLVAPD